MSQVTIRRPLGELYLCNQLGSRTEYGRRQTPDLSKHAEHIDEVCVAYIERDRRLRLCRRRSWGCREKKENTKGENATNNKSTFVEPVDRGRRAARTPPIQFVSYFQIVNKPISRPLKRFYSPVPPHFMLIGRVFYLPSL